MSCLISDRAVFRPRASSRRTEPRRRAPLLLAAGLTLLVVAAPLAAQRSAPGWYRSNRDLMLLEESLPPPVPGMRFMVRVSHQQADDRLIERRVLFENGTEMGAMELAFTADGQLVELTQWRPDGELELRESYAYRADGTLRRVSRRYPDGEYTDVRLGDTEYLSGPDWSLLMQYDQEGRPVRTERRDQDALRVEERSYGPDGALQQVIRVAAADTTVIRYEDGRVVYEEERSDGRLVEERRFSYDEAGRLVRSEVQRRRTTVVEERRYPAEGGELRYQYENGTLVLAEDIGPDGSRVVTHYHAGEPILERRYRDGEVVAEKVLGR